jgi:hypothetical protein
MSGGRRHPALVEERAELAALREQAAQTRREAAETITALADKVAARDPRSRARHAIAVRRAALSRAMHSRAALLGGPAVLAMCAALLAYRRYRL